MPSFLLHWDAAELDRMFDDPGGPLRPLMTTLGEIVTAGAKRRAERRTGRMAAAIDYVIGEDELGVYVDVISPAQDPKTGFPYAIVHEGKKVRDRRAHRSLRPALTDVRKILG